MIKLNNNLTRASREALIKTIVSKLLTTKSVTKTAKELGVSIHSIYTIQRAFTYGSSSYIKQVYKGLKTYIMMNQELKGAKKIRTFEEGYSIAGGSPHYLKPEELATIAKEGAIIKSRVLKKPVMVPNNLEKFTKNKQAETINTSKPSYFAKPAEMHGIKMEINGVKLDIILHKGDRITLYT